MCWRQIHNYDIWWHLASGQHICQKHRIPHQDIFSFTQAGKTWIDLHWAFQVTTFQAYRLLGPRGLVILKTMLIFAAWIILLLLPWARSHPLLASIIFAAGMAAGLNTYLARPTVVTMAFLAANILFLEKGVRENPKWLWLLIPLQAAWINFHSLFILGLFCIYSFLVGEILQWIIAARMKKARPIPAHLKTLLIVALASTAASLINPYHYQGLVFPGQLFRQVSGQAGVISQATLEFTPPFYTKITTLPLRAFRILLWLSALSFIVNLPRIRLRFLFLYIGFAYLALTAIRNLSLFGLIAAAVSVYNLGQAWEETRERLAARFPGSIQPRALQAGAIVISVLLLATGWMLARDRIKTEAPFGAGVKWSRYPAGAAAFILREDVPGPGFNVFEDGGYLIWKLYPGYRVFIDGRQQIGGERFFSLYTTMVTEPYRWDEISGEWDLNYILLNHTNSSYQELVRTIYHHPGYALVYMDSLSLLFVKRISKNALLIRGNEITLKDMEPVTAPSIPVKIKAPAEDRARGEESANHVRMGTLYSLLELPNLAMHEYAKALEMDPSRALTYFKIALLLDDEGRQDRAREYVQKSLELDPGLVNAHVLLAMMKEDVEPEVAKDHYLKALEAFPHYGPVHKRLAELYLDQGDFKNALRQINSARSDRYYEHPPDLDLCEARALIGLQKWKRAREVLEGYLIKRPHDTAALEMMKQVEKALNI